MPALVALTFAGGCDNTNEPSTPSQITSTSTGPLSAPAGASVNVTVRVDASNGRALSNQPVTFAVATGGGSVSPVTATTDASGLATTAWRLGAALGAQTLTITSGSVVSTINATATVGAPASVAFTAGAGQTAQAGTVVSTPPAVTVRDAGGNPVPGVQVTFSSTPSGTVTPTTVTTDASGVARLTSFTLGTQAGTYTLQATVLASNVTGNPATITATATSAGASRVDIVAGNSGSATVGSAVAAANLPSVAVRDQFGNPVAGVQVTFAVTSGGGTITGGTQTTNAQGVATVGGFTLGQTAGANTITATAQGVGAANFTVTGTSGAAAQAVVVAGNNQAVPAGQALQTGPSVRVVDRFGNPVSGVTVQFVVTGGGASLLGSAQTTNAAGVATVGGVVLGTTPGTNTIVARVAGVPDVTFTATGLAGPAAQLIRVSGDSQTVVAFRSSAQPLVVRVLDAAGFPVRNAPVTFSLAAAGTGSLSITTAQTDSLGRASTTFTANSFIGQNTVTATSGNLAAVQFVVTTTNNVVASIVATTPTDQTATAGGPVPFAPTVQLRDAFGNPVAGITITFGVYTGSGSVTNGTAVSDANGLATSGTWVISGTPGENLLAAIAGVPSNVPGSTITFRANGITAPVNATLTQVAGVTPSTAPAGSVVPISVQVRDGNGNPVQGLTVQFQVTAGGGNIGGQVLASAVTNASGIATISNYTLGTDPATLNSVSAAVFGTGLIIPISITTQ